MSRVTARSRPVASRKRPVRKPRQMAGHRREIAIPWDTCCMHLWTAERERRSSMRICAMPSTTVLPKARSRQQLGSAHRVGRKLVRLTVHVHACGMPAVPHVVKSTTWGIFGSGGRARSKIRPHFKPLKTLPFALRGSLSVLRRCATVVAQGKGIQFGRTVQAVPGG